MRRIILGASAGTCYRSPVPRKCFVSHRNLVSLREKHKVFLGLVDGHGAGSVTLTYDYPKQIATLSFTNETVRNAISGRMMNQLADALDILLDDGSKPTKATQITPGTGNKSDQPVVGLLLRSSGNIFSAGADLNLVREIVNTAQLGISMSQFMTDAFTRVRSSGLISVCLINGTAIGGGAEIITVCDYRLMTDAPDRHICFVHAKIGASPGWGSASRLVSIIGRQKALRLLGSSANVQADEALSLGLIDGIVQDTKCDAPASEAESDIIVYSASLQAAGEAFLLPFTAQPFSKAVASAKILVASNEYLSKKHTQELELKTFGERWGSDEKKSAIEKKK